MLKRVYPLGLLLLLLIVPSPILAQESVSRWLQYTAEVTVQPNSEIFVEETQEVALFSGVTSFTRLIPADEVEGIRNIEVIEINPNSGSHRYQLVDSGGDYTFQLVPEGDQWAIRLFFPQNNTASTKFTLRYTVAGKLRIYEAGDRLEWYPFGRSIVAPIDQANIIVNLPSTFSEEQLVYEARGITAEGSVSTDKIRFTATNITASDSLEIFVTFPHGAVQGTPPVWQQEIDTLEFWTPILQIGGLALGILFFLLIPVAVYLWWIYKKREATKSVPKYIKSPPSSLTPAIAGALVDGAVNSKHLLAMLLDMANRGIINIQDSPEETDEATNKQETPPFNLYPANRNKLNKAYEIMLFSRIFQEGNEEKSQLSKIRRMLFLTTPEIKNQLESELVGIGYFFSGPNPQRRRLIILASIIIVISLALALVILIPLNRFTYLVVSPFVGIALGAISLIIAGFLLPKRTNGGVKEAARWSAFKRYLEEMNTQEVAKNQSEFSQLLP
ncbi:MAG: DUF2207 domain-containing protein, partial [Chloroflexota bacterium]